MSFLTVLYEQKLSYSSINGARSAIEALNWEGHSEKYTRILKKFMKGIFNARPALPRYNTTWDPELVLKLFTGMEDNINLSLKELTLKTATLLTLLSGRRGQTIISLHIDNITFSDTEMRISLGDLLKTSRRDFQEPEIVLKEYPNKKICIVDTVQAYIRRTNQIRENEKQLFISHSWPFGKITRDTLGRYIREVLKMAGVNMRFKPHSLRSAAVSKAAGKNVSIATIMAGIGWKQESTFATYYNKPLDKNTGEISEAILANGN